MRKEDGLFITRFHRNLVVWEIVKCIFLSILLVPLIYSPMVMALFEGINPFLALSLALILGFLIFYFLLFKSRIKKIKDNLLDIVEKRLVKKVAKFYRKVSDCERIIYQNRMNDNRVSAMEHKLKIKEKRYLSKISSDEKIVNAIKISRFD